MDDGLRDYKPEAVALLTKSLRRLIFFVELVPRCHRPIAQQRL